MTIIDNYQTSQNEDDVNGLDNFSSNNRSDKHTAMTEELLSTGDEGEHELALDKRYVDPATLSEPARSVSASVKEVDDDVLIDFDTASMLAEKSVLGNECNQCPDNPGYLRLH
eukprot:4125098-Karenia_brevis.AAC.1